jgi:hypothetical protein
MNTTKLYDRKEFKNSQFFLDLQKELEKNEEAHKYHLIARYNASDLVEAWCAGWIAAKEEVRQSS